MVQKITITQNDTEVNLNDNLGIVALVPQWCRTFHIIFIAIVFFTGLPGNTLVILIQAKNKRKTSTDWLVTYVAVSDVMSLVVNIPVYNMILAQCWPSIGSTFGCRFHHFVLHLTAAASSIMIACIAVDILWKSTSVNQLFTPNQAFYSGIVAFGISVFIGAMAAFASSNNAFGQCVYDKSRESLQAIVYLVMIAGSVITSSITIYSYVRIVIILKNKARVNPVSNTSTTATENRRTVTTSFPIGHYGKALRTTKLMFLVTLVFMVSTMIPAIAAIGKAIANDGTGSTPMIVAFLLKKMYLFNNCTNPFIYIWLNTAFRKKAISIIKDSCFAC